MNPPSRWQLVLYGRTHRADRWWRVRPSDVDVHWLNALVVASTGGGDGLADQPRFLLARHRDVVLVGAAGRAALLSATMNSDGSRPFYCFVGWVSQDRGAAAPSLEVLEARWIPWASAAYEAWMPLDWDKHPTDLTDAHEPPFGAAPWTGEPEPELAAAVPSAVEPHQELPLPHAGGRPTVLPASARARAWAGLIASPGDFAIAACFDRPSADTAGVLTHVVVANSDEVGHDVAGTPPDPPDGTAGPDSPPVQPPLRDAGQLPAAGARTAAPPPHAKAPPAKTAPEEQPRGGMLGKASRALKSLVSTQELHPEADVGERHPHRGAPETPAVGHGPAKDLDYWRRMQADNPSPKDRPEEKPRPASEDL